MLFFFNSQKDLQICMVWKLANSSIENCIVPVIMSSPELKARELFGSPVVRTYVCLLCTFSSSQEPLSQFQPNLAQSIL